MVSNFMQCLLFALMQLITSYSKSSFYLKQLLFSLSIISHVKSAWSIRISIGQVLIRTLRGHVHPSVALVPGTSYLWRSKIAIFKCYLCFARLENLFKNCIFVISIQNCILQLNFKAQLLLIKIQLITAKSQIQATWRHLLPGNIFKSETFNNYFRTVFAHLWKLTMQ